MTADDELALSAVPDEILRLLDRAREEAREHRHAEVLPVHLIAALAAIDPDGAGRLLGPDVGARVAKALADLPAESPVTGTAEETYELLSWAGEGPDVMERLVDALRSTLQDLVPAEAGDALVDASEPAWPAHWPAPDGTFHLVASADTVGIDAAATAAAELLALSDPATPCVVGPAGSGRTTLLGAIARRIAEDHPFAALRTRPMVRVRAEVVLGRGRSTTLREIAAWASGEAILALDDLEVLLGLTSPAVDLDLRGVVRSLVDRPDVLTVVTLDAACLERLRAEEAELVSKLVTVPVPDLDEDHLVEIGHRQRLRLTLHHGVAVSDEAVVTAAGAPQTGDLLAHPGLLLHRLDRGCVRARMRRSSTLEPDDLDLTEERPAWLGIDGADLARRLRSHVLGQDEALDRVCQRVALTGASLDLRPHRPNGVFLLVGPTGVGKTELAKALAVEVFGARDLLIRLDMSEYEREWAVSRLIGPQPGYIGSDQPESWLTTKVIDKPTSVILLDEVEKAHPVVWNVFLQVFDEGRLTDSKGRTAQFSDTVVIMTSNLGASAFTAAPVGFGDGGSRLADAEADVRATIARTLPPELVNRLDAVVMFRPLTVATIEQITRRELERLVKRLADRGWDLHLDPEVAPFLAREGHDPAFGARHLQRNLERHLLEALVPRSPGSWRVGVDGRSLTWEQVT